MSRDGWIGAGLLLFCAWLYAGLERIPVNPLVPIGPAFYPRFLLLLMFVLSLTLVLRELVARREKKYRVPFAAWLKEHRPVLLTFFLFSLYVFLLPKLGFLMATLLFVSTLHWLLGRSALGRVPESLVTGMATAVVIYWVFEKYLYVFLPRAAWLP